MMRSLLTAATGMDAQQVTIDTIANNLANVNTVAFKQSRANFHDLLYQTLKAPGQSSTTGTVVPSGIQIGAGTRVSSVEKVFQHGSTRITERPFDLQIEGEGFYRIQKDDGGVAYTRAGNFQIDNTGRLVNNAGFPLIPEITIPQNIPHDRVSVGMDGVVSIRDGEKSEVIGQLDLAMFVNPAGLDSLGHNLYGATVSSGEPIIGKPGQDDFGRIAQGQLENSNVNIVEEMVNMITGQRAYEINSKVIQTGDQMLQQTVNIR